MTYEIHEKEVDVQILLSGYELMELADPSSLREKIPYDSLKEASFAKGESCIQYHATSSSFALFFPGEPHACNLVDTQTTDVVKVVFKILM